MKKIVLVTYEFTYSPFSGNGILARSLVKSFLGLGCTVTVWCCRPSDSAETSENNPLASPEITRNSEDRLEVVSNVVGAGCWKRVDKKSGWKEFSIFERISNEQSLRLQSAISDADAICVIDWTGAAAYRTVTENQILKDIATNKFHLYLNFRVFGLGVDDEQMKAWYDEMEYEAMRSAHAIVSLSSKDSGQLSTILRRQNSEKKVIPIEIVLPPLRQDMETFAKRKNFSQSDSAYLPDPIRKIAASTAERRQGLVSRRPFLTCVARQSPEKCIQRFVTFVERASDTLEELNLTVILAGAVSDPAYAKKCQERLLRAMPSSSVIVLDRFLSPNELGALFAHTILNFHPSSYDAYGMTIVEAAAFGVPTVLAGPSIGAFRLLGSDGCIQVDMSDPDESNFSDTSLDSILRFLREAAIDEKSWEKLSRNAREKSLAWDERSYGKQILSIINKYGSLQERY